MAEAPVHRRLDVPKRVGVLGAASLVGSCLLPLLIQGGWQVTAYSRRTQNLDAKSINWRGLPAPEVPAESAIEHWLCVAPIWILPEHFALMEAHGVRRLVALSSTSRFTKDNSSDPAEQAVARRLAEAEQCLQNWATRQGVEWVILRPTLIYGFGKDKNIAEIARFIRRFRFFPLFGPADGLRQPVHAHDVASACLAAMIVRGMTNRAYNLAGGETLTYREMVCRIFAAMGLRPRLLTVPLALFRLAVACFRRLPRYRHWSVAMAERMNRNLVFDYDAAARNLGFRPRNFRLSEEDVSV